MACHHTVQLLILEQVHQTHRQIRLLLMRLRSGKAARRTSDFISCSSWIYGTIISTRSFPLVLPVHYTLISTLFLSLHPTCHVKLAKREAFTSPQHGCHPVTRTVTRPCHTLFDLSLFAQNHHHLVFAIKLETRQYGNQQGARNVTSAKTTR